MRDNQPEIQFAQFAAVCHPQARKLVTRCSQFSLRAPLGSANCKLTVPVALLLDNPPPPGIPQTEIVFIDTREPAEADGRHPWQRYWPANVMGSRATLATGDLCLASNPAVVIERKTPSDLISCLTGGRERFERELLRATYLMAFAVVISGSLADCIRLRRGLHLNALLGTLAAWQRRYRVPFFFAGNDALAANFCFRFLKQSAAEPACPKGIREAIGEI